MDNKVYLGLGSNLGNKTQNIQDGIKNIDKLIGKIKKTAKLYKTEPWGFDSENWFLNTVVEVNTKLNPQEVLACCLQIESQLGRERNILKQGYSSRTIDIDILFFNNEIINTPNLTIPHPHIQNRNFVLFPLNDIAPDFTHPVLNKTINNLLKSCNDKTLLSEV